MKERIDAESIRQSVNLAEYAAKFFEVKRAGKEFRALCPFHADTTRSLSISEYRGKWRYRCWSCGETGDLFDFYAAMHGLDVKRDFKKILNALANGDGEPIPLAPLKKAPPRLTTKPPVSMDAPDFLLRSGLAPESTHPYLNAVSECLGYAAWYGGEEGMRYWTWGSRSEHDPVKWDVAPFSAPRPLYGIEQLARKPKAQVIITEDERICDAAAELFPRFACMTWPGGRFALQGIDWLPLAGRRIVLIPTADGAGRQAMQRVAAWLWEAGVEAIIGINTDIIPLNGDPGAALMDAPDGWTLADALAEGWPPENALRWARANKEEYPNPATKQNPAPQVAASSPSSEVKAADNEEAAESLFPSAPMPFPPAEAGPNNATPKVEQPPVAVTTAPSGVAPESPQDDAKPPPSLPTDFPPDALPERPKRPPKADFGVVEGNTVRKPKRQEVGPEVPLPEEFSDDAYAEQWSERYSGQWRYTPALKAWHQWDGVRWLEDEKNSLHHKTRHFLRESLYGARELSGKQRRSIVTDDRVRAVLRLAGADPRHATGRDEWDALPLLGTPAGPVDLATGKLLAPDPAHMISRITSVAPAAEPMPYWDKVVGRITRGDSSLLGYVQRWCGFMLTGGENIHEAFLFVVGAGSSGKSKFITTLEDIAGGYFRKIDKEVFTHSGDKNVNIGEKIARLQGARLVTCSELEEGSRWRESLLKDFTGRERVEGRALYQATTEFKPSFRLIFSGNFKPALRSTGEEIRRRLHLLEFPGIIPEEERILDLPDKLRIEHPAILAWMIEGALMLKDAGLGKPEQILDSTAEYLSEEDTLAAWFMACCVADAEASTQSGAAYKSFVAWAKENGEHFIPSAKRFSQKLRDRGHAIKRTSLGSQISGFTLTVNAAPTPSYADV